MAIKCFFGFHSWFGCMCADCRKIRDVDHDWSKDCEKCSKCGAVGSHMWEGCKCNRCGKTHDEQHTWSGAKCTKCNKSRNESKDRLIYNLQSLNVDDLKSLLVGGLRIKETKLSGLMHEDLVMLCSRELRESAGSSLINLTRKPHEFPYKQLLIDVADKLSDGNTPLGWTNYQLHDDHTEEEIEQTVMELFEERARKWWIGLSESKRQEFVEGINSVLQGDESTSKPLKEGPLPYIKQQAVEQLIQTGLVMGLSKVAAGGVLGVAGATIIGQLGWVILIQTVGWMMGLKIAIFGIGGLGAFGGAITWVGATAVGAVVALPGLVVLFDGPAYRKTVPTTIMLLAKIRINRFEAEQKS